MSLYVSDGYVINTVNNIAIITDEDEEYGAID